jgi:hypothetical protein
MANKTIIINGATRRSVAVATWRLSLYNYAMRKLKNPLWFVGLDRNSIESLLIVFLIMLALLARLIPGPRMIDDAFITFRYARNIVQGIGFVYNSGEHVLGTTTPLYTLWMAALSLVTHTENYPILALVTNALADAVSTYLLYHLGKRLSNSPLVGLAAALLWAIGPMSVTFAIGGMETSVFILLMLGTFTAHLERRPYLTAVLAALSFLTRPDAVLIVALVFGQVFLENLKSQIPNLKHLSKAPGNLLKLEIWRLIFVFLIVIAPWIIFATVYFGSPIPQSVSAKSLGYVLPPEAGLGRLIQHFSVPFFESDVLDLSGLIRLVIYLTLYLAATLAAFRRDSRSLPLLAYPALYAAAFAVGNPLIFRWYLAPPLPAYFLGLLLGLYRILNIQYPIPNFKSEFTMRTLRSDIGNWIFVPLVALYLTTSLRAWTLHPDHGPDRPAPKMAFIQLELLYHQVAADLKPQVGPDTVIAAGDIGALGYDTGAHILDTLGLISPQTLRYYPLDPKLYVINYAMSPQLINDQEPDWLVAPEVYLRKGVLLDTQFQAQYQLFEKIPSDIYGSDGLLVFRRK